MRNPPWTKDELILALDLYFRFNPLRISPNHEEVKHLSNILNQLPKYSDSIDANTYRNANAVYMKLCNFLRFDEQYKGVGLTRGGQLEKDVWDKFAHDKNELHKIALSIQDQLQSVESEHMDDEEEEEFAEGKVLYRKHKSRERNSSLINKAKKQGEKDNVLCCSICNFDFYKTYGELGKGYIECHHTVPVSEYSSNRKTKLSDLILVCSNCHRMLHRKRPWLQKSDIMSIITDN